jgi:hypothetical protein
MVLTDTLRSFGKVHGRPFIVAVTLRRSTSRTRPRRPAGPLTDRRLTDGPWPDGPAVPTGAPPGPWGPR